MLTWVAVEATGSTGMRARSSTRIRNYLGFSRGLSGAELAQRAYQQAWVFGARFLLTREVVARDALAVPVGDREVDRPVLVVGDRDSLHVGAADAVVAVLEHEPPHRASVHELTKPGRWIAQGLDVMPERTPKPDGERNLETLLQRVVTLGKSYKAAWGET